MRNISLRNAAVISFVLGALAFVTVVFQLVSGSGLANADRAEIITILGIYTHAWFLSFALGLPFVVLTYEFLAIRKKDQDYMKAAIRASRIWGISFAAGAVTGTLVEFGLVQIWSGSLLAIGSFFFAPLFIELFAFITEIVFIVIYLYTWSMYKYRWKHWLFGLFILVGSVWSGYQILAVNAWMNVPWGTGDLVSKVLPWTPALGPNVTNSTAMIQIFNALPAAGSSILGNLGVIQSIGQIITDPFVVFANPEAIPVLFHTVLAAITAVGFLGSMFLAWSYFKNTAKREYYAKLIKIPFGVGAIAALIQPILGDIEARMEYSYMYTKFLGAEGIPSQGGTNPFLGLLLFGDANHYFPGFDYLRTLVGSSIAPGMASATIQFAEQNQFWVSAMYYTMVFSGIVTFILAIVYFGLFSRHIDRIVRALFRRETIDVIFRVSLIAPFFALAAAILGWAIREVGRHPWSVMGLMTYNEIVTPVDLTWGYIMLIAAAEIAIGVLGTFAMYVSLRWKTKEETLSSEPESIYTEAMAK